MSKKKEGLKTLLMCVALERLVKAIKPDGADLPAGTHRVDQLIHIHGDIIKGKPSSRTSKTLLVAHRDILAGIFASSTVAECEHAIKSSLRKLPSVNVTHRDVLAMVLQDYGDDREAVIQKAALKHKAEKIKPTVYKRIDELIAGGGTPVPNEVLSQIDKEIATCAEANGLVEKQSTSVKGKTTGAPRHEVVEDKSTFAA